jgi:hypothetical protein
VPASGGTRAGRAAGWHHGEMCGDMGKMWGRCRGDVGEI